VHVYSYKLSTIALPAIDFSLKCSKGFYVRTYCYDIGQDLGCGGHLSRLERTRSGNFSLSQSVTLPELETMNSTAELQSRVLSLAEISRIRRQ